VSFSLNEIITDIQPCLWAAHPYCSAWHSQHSTLRRMTNFASTFGLSNNNKWRWSVWTVAAYRRTHSTSRLTSSEGDHLQAHSSDEPPEFSQWPYHGESTTKNKMSVIIIIIIIIILNRISLIILQLSSLRKRFSFISFHYC